MSKIVIIEDNELIARIYETKLKKEGHTTGIATDGKTGLELVRKAAPDLVLVDLILPDMSGVDLIKELREETEFANLSIVAFSSDKNLLEQVKKYNPTEIISKTELSPRKILAQIEILLETTDVFAGNNSNQTDSENGNSSNEVSSNLLKRFLVVEDDPIISKIVERTIEKLGFTAVCVEDGKEAYRILDKDANFVAGIFDVEVPHIKGTDLVKQMRTEKRLAGIPVIMMTADQSMSVHIQSFSAGATLFLTKPFEIETLEKTINLLVKSKNSV